MARHQRPGPTVTLEEARRLLVAELHRLEPHEVPLDESVGCALAEAVVATEDVPPFANAAMDGFAVRAEDTRSVAARLLLVGDVTAGKPAAGPLGPGEAMAIATGAPVPKGADAVCMVEYAAVDGPEVVLDMAVDEGQNVRYPGEDIARGTLVFPPSTVLGPSHVGVLASLGVARVAVYPHARVGVLATGDELRRDPGPLAPGQIHESNRHAFLAMTRRAGCHGADLGVVADDEDSIARAVERGAESCDAIVTSGGVSVGVADHMKTVLGRLSGGRARWMEVAIRPAKPFGFAVLVPSGVPVLCMPGNPVSALVGFELLVRPALRFMTGHRDLARPALLATAEARMGRHRDGKVHFIRAVARVDDEGRLVTRPSGGQGSHQLYAMARANALVVLPDGDGVDAGDPVRMLLFDEDGLRGERVTS
ncbi:MAG: molybdopterin molybdotransferase MoeA [Acidimicrobiales bacterium]